MRPQRRRPPRGQVLVIFALALPVLLGLLGLTLDGGYYLAAAEAAQFAARAGARAATVAIQTGAYTTATATGQAVGQRNLAALQLTGVTLSIAYNNTPNATPSTPGWYTSTPGAQTSAVMATASGTYRTLFLPFVGVTSAAIQRAAVVTMGGGALPLGVCANDVATRPAGPWILWEDKGTLCSVNSWDGYVGLDGQSHTCAEYRAQILPGPPTGRVSATTIALNQQRRCPSLSDQPDNWLATQYYLDNPVQTIVIVDTGAGNRLAGCVRVLLVAETATHRVVGVPQPIPAAVTPCSTAGVQETY